MNAFFSKGHNSLSYQMFLTVSANHLNKNSRVWLFFIYVYYMLTKHISLLPGLVSCGPPYFLLRLACALPSTLRASSSCLSTSVSWRGCTLFYFRCSSFRVRRNSMAKQAVPQLLSALCFLTFIQCHRQVFHEIHKLHLKWRNSLMTIRVIVQVA